jgi:hypothetical protein
MSDTENKIPTRDDVAKFIQIMRDDSLVDFMRVSDREMVIDRILEFSIMYGKQLSVGFMEWKNENGWGFDKVARSGKHYYSRHHDSKSDTPNLVDSTSDLFEIYLDKLKK